MVSIFLVKLFWVIRLVNRAVKKLESLKYRGDKCLNISVKRKVMAIKSSFEKEETLGGARGAMT